MYIIYQSDSEVIVCTQADEANVIKVFFHDGGRDLDDYDREVRNEPFAITFRTHID